MQLPDHTFLRVRDMATLLSVSPSRVYQLLADGEIPVSKIGGAYRVPKDAWDSWVSQKSAEALAASRKSAA